MLPNWAFGPRINMLLFDSDGVQLTYLILHLTKIYSERQSVGGKSRWARYQRMRRKEKGAKARKRGKRRRKRTQAKKRQGRKGRKRAFSLRERAQIAPPSSSPLSFYEPSILRRRRVAFFSRLSSPLPSSAGRERTFFLPSHLFLA